MTAPETATATAAPKPTFVAAARTGITVTPDTFRRMSWIKDRESNAIKINLTWVEFFARFLASGNVTIPAEVKRPSRHQRIHAMTKTSINVRGDILAKLRAAKRVESKTCGCKLSWDEFLTLLFRLDKIKLKAKS